MSATIIERAREICLLPGFGAPGLWLTFYLCSDPAKLNALAGILADIGAVNLDNADGGFLYPKLPVKNDPSAMAILVGQLLDFAAAYEVQIIAVDVDTSPDVKATAFRELIRF